MAESSSPENTPDAHVPRDSKFPWYLGIIGIYTLVTFGANRSSECHDNLKTASLRDIAMLALAAYKAARVAALDEVTRPLRAPFIYETTEDGNTTEIARSEGWRGAVGNLALCSDCLAFWMAVVLTYAYMISPRTTRVLAGPLALSAISSFLNNATALMSALDTSLETSTEAEMGGSLHPA
ncbi:MAG: DUF1360 domain-containing protein [Armatimonadetes bacterium]|nr:DUF1360 domain-containing protein [Armatimonadota bacterium]